MGYPAILSLSVLTIVLAGCAGLAPSPSQQHQLQRVATELPPAGQPVFHVVGLYQGLPPPWHNEDCRDITEPECQRAIRHQVEHEVEVRIAATDRPVILGLSAYERTHWRLRPAPGVEIERVILSGHYPQGLSGIGAQVPVEYYVDRKEGCPAARCEETGTGFYDFRAPARRYEELVAQPPTSFRGAQEDGWITIDPERTGIHPR